MADLAVTAANVNVARQPVDGTIIRPYIAGYAATAGDAIYIDSSGLAQQADASQAGKQQFRGIALQTVGVQQALDVCERGILEGFTITQAYDALLYLDTTGQIADAANGTKTVRVGRVVATSTKDSSGNIKKLVYIQSDMLNNW